MELDPISLAQVRAGRNGRMIEIDNDVLGVVAKIKRIDNRLHVRWNDNAEYFTVYCRLPTDPPNCGTVVFNTPVLDDRVVQEIERAAWEQRQPGYSYADELDKADARAEKAADDRISEKIAEGAEKLAFALRKDLGKNDHRIVVARDLPKDK